MEIKISEIQIGDNRRPVDQEAVANLADSIKEVGLLNAITVTSDKKLVAGAHRLEACKSLGWASIPANVVELSDLRARLAEIDENLVRNELHYIDQCDQIAERKEIYEALHPASKSTNDGGGFKGNQHVEVSTPGGVTSFVQDTAQKTGKAKSRIFSDIQIANKLTDDSKQSAKELDLRKKEAIVLARMEPEKQKEAINKRAAGEVKDIRELAPPARVRKPKNKTSTQEISDTIQSIKNPEMTKHLTLDCDIRAAELANHIHVFAESLYDYAHGDYSVKGMSPASKQKITAAICEMETAVKFIEKLTKEKSA